MIKRFTSDFLEKLLDGAAILLIAFLCLSSMILAGSWHGTHSGNQYLLATEFFTEAFREGFGYPRWLPEPFGGLGDSTFCFYPPGFFFIALPFTLSISSLVKAIHMTLLLLFFVGGFGAYLLCREISSRAIGFLGAILFLFTPYLYVNLHVRGDLAELTAMLLTPWPLYFLLLLKSRAEQPDRESWGLMAGMTLSLFGIILSHPATALFFVPVFILMALAAGLGVQDKKYFLVRAAVSLAVALALSNPYWLTVFQMKAYAKLEAAADGFYSAHRQTVYPFQLISRKWDWGGATLDNAEDQMSYQLGLVHLILAVAGGFYGRRNGFVRAAFVLYIGLILFMTPLAGFFWEHISLLRFAQFPWRLLSVTAVLQAVCIAGLYHRIERIQSSERKAMLFLFLGCVAWLWYQNAFQLIAVPPGDMNALKAEVRNGFITISGTEYLPKIVYEHPPQTPRGFGPILQTQAESEPMEGHSPYQIRYRVTNNAPATVLIQQLYLPEWAIFVDGTRISRAAIESNLSPDGRIQIPLNPPGTHTVVAYYDGPPGGRIRALIAGVAVLAFLGFARYDRRRSRTAVTDGR